MLGLAGFARKPGRAEDSILMSIADSLTPTERSQTLTYWMHSRLVRSSARFAVLLVLYLGGCDDSPSPLATIPAETIEDPDPIAETTEDPDPTAETIEDPDPISSNSGKMLQVNGNGYMVISNNESLHLPQQFTIELWFRVERLISGNLSGWNQLLANNVYEIAIDELNGHVITFCSDRMSPTLLLWGNTEIHTKQWYHIALVRSFTKSL